MNKISPLIFFYSLLVLMAQILVPKINYYNSKMITVSMSLGGLSTKGLESNYLTSKEQVGNWAKIYTHMKNNWIRSLLLGFIGYLILSNMF